MTVVANFTNVIGGSPSEPTIQFTDVSTGSPTNWLWNFGDGNFSYLQNPSHTYIGLTHTTISVSLNTWVSGGSSTSNLLQGDSAKRYSQQGFYTDGNAAAHANLLLTLDTLGWTNPTTPSGPYYVADKIPPDSLIRYKIAKTLYPVSTAVAPAISVLESRFSSRETDEGSFLSTIWGTQAHSNPDVWAVYAHPDAGTNYGDVMFEPIGDVVPSVLTEPSINNSSGFSVGLRKVTWNISGDDPDNVDTMTKVLIIPAIIDFVGTPLIGTSPLSVQFTDLSIVDHAISTWNFGDGNGVTVAGQTHPINTYVIIDI